MTDEHFIRGSGAAGRAGGTWRIADYAGIRVASLALAPGDVTDLETTAETAWLLMSGAVRGTAADLASLTALSGS